MRPASIAALLFACVLASQCSNTAIVDVTIGPLNTTVDSSQVASMIPAQFINSSTNTLAMISCTTDTDCPQLGAGEPAVHCTSSLCTPDPFSFVIASSVIDLNTNATVQMYGSNVTVLQLREVDYTATSQGLTDSVGPSDLYWGPETATSVSSSGVTHLGTIPVIQLTAGSTTGSSPVTLDATGAAALSSYLLNTSRRFLLFTVPQVSVAPGGPVPSGSVALQVEMQVHIEGQLVR